MRYAFNLGEDGRILSVTYAKYAPADAVQVDELPEDNVSDYLYIDGQYVYDPLPKPKLPDPEPTAEEMFNALLGVTE